MGNKTTGWSLRHHLKQKSVCQRSAHSRSSIFRSTEIIERINGKQTPSNPLFISEEHFEEILRATGAPAEGDLLLTSRGTLGVPYVVRSNDRFHFADGNLTWFRTFKGLDSRFLHYYLLSPRGKAELKKCVIGSSQPAYTINALKNISVLLPPLGVQDRIASVLSAFDDLIENNTRRIKILEEMAQMIYREWFVNFHFPGHEKVRMVDSELGPIPEGWVAGPLAEIADVNALVVKPQNAPTEIQYVDIASVSTGKIDKIQPLNFSVAPGRARRIVHHGDIIWSTVRPNRRSYALILKPDSNLIVSTGFAVLSAASVPFSYLYAAVTTDAFADYLTNQATGSAYPAVTGKTFEKAIILIPSAPQLRRFHEIVAPMLELSRCLDRRNANLRATRDLLLPKLISGEIPVEAAEEKGSEIMAAIA